ncbi:hypothetical protein MKX01_013074 [Papaver californicum]|nr:hypothetical protein MKX01_013074 [Papaver californicum]
MGLFMESLNKPNHPKKFLVIPLVIITLVITFISMITILKRYLPKQTIRRNNLLSRTCSSPPVVPGLPLIGNLLQLKDKITHQVFANWAEIYGPIYSIKTGASTIVVLNSTDVAKEAIVSRFSSIIKRKHTYAMNILTNNTIVTSDTTEYHNMARRHLVTHMLGAGAQRRHHTHRDIMENPLKPINFRMIFQTEVFGLTLKQALGMDAVGSSKYIEGLGETLSRDEIYKVLVSDPQRGAAEVDWREFFPYMRWIPNKSFEMHIGRMETRRLEVLKTLIEEQHKRISSGEVYTARSPILINFSLSWNKLFSGLVDVQIQLSMLIWETLFVGSETTLQAAEWATYELAKHLKYQDHLYREIQEVCGNSKYTEEQYSGRYPPIPVGTLKYVHEDIQLGGYDIAAGTQIAINFYGCNMDKKQWDSPEKCTPERFLDSNKHDPKDLHKTMSFGGGKRVCPGALQGLSITCTIIAQCIQEFKWNFELGTQEEDIITSELHPLLAIIIPRE